MLDSIHVGMTGLLGYAQGLRVIANNTANLNTPGYKASTLQFTDLFYANGGGGAPLGHGLATAGSRLDLRAGDLRQTGNAQDVAIDGEGLFVLRRTDGGNAYTRAGQFTFDADGVLVHRLDGRRVVGTDAAGQPVDITLAGLRSSPAQATATVRLAGNLSSTASEQTVGGIEILDALGQPHLLALRLTSTQAEAPGSWRAELLDGATVVGTATLAFADGQPTPATARLTFAYAPAGHAARDLTLDFSQNVSSFASGSLSTLAFSSRDGRAPGQLTGVAFDARGTLVASYSNGQKAEGARLLLARFPSQEGVAPKGGGQFEEAAGIAWERGGAGDAGFGAVRGGMLEGSNVDLSREFSDLVVLQRGYQASSQIISTANDMLQELFRMKAR